MFNHLTSNKNKHNRNFLQKFNHIPTSLTVDQVFNSSRNVFDEEKKKNHGRIDIELKQISNKKDYLEIKHRRLDWTEDKAKRIKEEPGSDLSHYERPSDGDLKKNTFEAFDKLQTQLGLVLEKLENCGDDEDIFEKYSEQFLNAQVQCKTMILIIASHANMDAEDFQKVQVNIDPF